MSPSKADSWATIHTLKTYREVLTTLIERRHGRVVDSPGDNMLAAFTSAVDAVESAVAIQHELKIRNAELEGRRQMAFQIGLNVGDVINDEGQLYGDGGEYRGALGWLSHPARDLPLVSRAYTDQEQARFGFLLPRGAGWSAVPDGHRAAPYPRNQ